LKQSTDTSDSQRQNHSSGVTLAVLVDGQTVFSMQSTRTVELGRQRLGEPGPFAHVALEECDRLIIAELTEATVSRRHVGVQPLGSQRVRLANLSQVNTVWIDSSQPLETNAQDAFDIPVFLTLGNAGLAVLIQPATDQDQGLQSLSQPTAVPGRQATGEMASLEQVFRSKWAAGDSGLLLSWLKNTMEVFQSAASSPDFLAKAAQAVIDTVELNQAAVLRWRDGRWEIEAEARDDQKTSVSWRPSRSLLDQVRDHKRTFWKSPFGEASVAEQPSLMALEAYVASPILDSDGNLIGALYGERRATGSSAIVAPITELEARMVELLSCSVAAGLARLEQEQAAVQARVLFEQFFTPELSEQLQADPTLLCGKDAQVTVLFCDIRGFSRISERVGAGRTFEWINAIMGKLSDCVLQHQGVLVDYIGDEIVAMWGAPHELAEHETCACRAALAMAAEMPELSRQWEEALGEPTSYTIGINTGPARVGNTGSKRKFKYGPLGNTVNLASRVQGAARHVRSQIVVTDSTADKLGEEFSKRRLCRVELVNIAEPIGLYELCTSADPSWLDLRDRYESALSAFESGEAHRATRILGNLLADYPDDGPTVILLSRAVDVLARRREDFSPIWRLAEK
jgi:adenylate cyclase